MCGRTQYALRASASHHASAIMRSGRTLSKGLEPPPPPMYPPTPPRHDVLRSFSTHPAGQLRSHSVKPVWVEGMGRVLLPQDAHREPLSNEGVAVDVGSIHGNGRLAVGILRKQHTAYAFNPHRPHGA